MLKDVMVMLFGWVLVFIAVGIQVYLVIYTPAYIALLYSFLAISMSLIGIKLCEEIETK